MKTLHPARRRLVIGILLLAAAFFYAFAPGCGVVGWAINRASAYLIGQTGSTLLALTLLVVGTLFVLPHGFLGSVARWFSYGREARVGKVVRAMDEHEDRRPAIEVVNRKFSSPDRPYDRKKLDDVRVALRSLQYLPHEYEPLVKAMDPTVPFETLVKGAIRQLSEKRN